MDKVTNSSENNPVVLSQQAFNDMLATIEELKEQVAWFQRMFFGKTSERHVLTHPDQLTLFEEDKIQEEQTEINTPSTEIDSQPKRNTSTQKPSRKPLPDHLPRQVITLEPENLPEGSIKIGEDITEVLERIPSSFFVMQYVRPRYKKSKDEDVFFQAPVPVLPIYKGKFGASVLSDLLVSKFCDHLPFYRLVKMFERENIQISEPTINNSLMNVCDLLTPLEEQQKQLLLQEDYIQADETPVKFQQNDGERKFRTGYHWVYHAPEQKIAVFDFQPSRSAMGPNQFLKNYSGTLQTDEYEVYNKLTNQNLTLIACMAHVRRKYVEAKNNDYKRASHVLNLIQDLYKIERQAKQQQLDSTAIKELRQQKALPILNSWKQWLDNQASKVRPKSAIGKAVQYTLKVWHKLVRYIEDGRYAIDNNQIENSIRPVAIGRKNYLFAGSVRGGKAAAMMYGFFGTCKMHGVNPYEWLKNVLSTIHTYPTEKIRDLLPQNWKPPDTE